MDGDITKRMGVNIGAIGDEGSIEGIGGRTLPVYSMAHTTERALTMAEGVMKMAEVDGRYFSGEAGGSGRYTGSRITKAAEISVE